MKKWCGLTTETLISEGRFVESRMVTHSGRALAEERDFLQGWASRLRQYYESGLAEDFLELDLPPPEPRTNTRGFYRRLFANGTSTEEFVTIASETLAHWIEVEMEDAVTSVQNRPHGNEPGYDLLSLIYDLNLRHSLRLVQVKATETNLQDDCGVALRKFQKLEHGEYDAQLSYDIRMHYDAGHLHPDCPPRELLYRVRHYRVVALHSEDRDTMKILTTFEDKIPGAVTRRSARLVRIDNWRVLWQALAEFVYAHLTD